MVLLPNSLLCVGLPAKFQGIIKSVNRPLNFVIELMLLVASPGLVEATLRQGIYITFNRISRVSHH